MEMRTLVPPLRTARLELRALSLADVPAYQRHFVDYEVIRGLARGVPWPYPPGGVESFLREVLLPLQGASRWTWGLFPTAALAECIGVVDLWREGCPENRGFWLGRAFWGQGLMTEAVTAVKDHAFTRLGFERLVFSNARQRPLAPREGANGCALDAGGAGAVRRSGALRTGGVGDDESRVAGVSSGSEMIASRELRPSTGRPARNPDLRRARH